jgi:hypothetical protein
MAGRAPFVHRLTKEQILAFKDAPPEAKLEWLEEANAFVGRFVGKRKRQRWSALVIKEGNPRV